MVAAGFVLPIDDPGLPDWWDMLKPEPTIEAYRKFAELRTNAVNRALVGIPEERVRYQLCWGSWHGPHTRELPLEHIIDLILEVKAQTYSFEAGNVRHEWRVWQQAKLPPGKMLMPGVVSHATNLLEHPQLLTDRILRYAAIVGRENVIAGTDSGLGGRVHVDLAWAKLRTIVEGARLASTSLWPSLNVLVDASEFSFRLSRVLAPFRAMSHTACRHAPRSMRRGDGAALRRRHGSAGHWGTPGKVSCRVLPVARARTRSPRLGVRGLRPASGCS